MSKPIRVLCADDHHVIRDGIAFALRSQHDMELVGEASNGGDAVTMFRQLRPDIALMDLQMPGMDGIEAIEAIRAFSPKARIVVLTTYAGDVKAQRALMAGATGYLLKHTLRTDLIQTIRTVHAGGRSVPPQIAWSIVEHLNADPLSAREIEILQSVSTGSSNKRIGTQLSISEDTVKSHIKHILVKLGANDRTHAVTIAIERGFLDPAE